MQGRQGVDEGTYPGRKRLEDRKERKKEVREESIGWRAGWRRIFFWLLLFSVLYGFINPQQTQPNSPPKPTLTKLPPDRAKDDPSQDLPQDPFHQLAVRLLRRQRDLEHPFDQAAPVHRVY